VYFPNIKLFSTNLSINCISGSHSTFLLRMTNSGPVPVIYRFLWAGESIDIRREIREVN